MDHRPKGFVGRAWARLRRPSATTSVLTLLLAGFVGGILFWGGFHTAVESSNSLEFCISCHEMRDNVYREYVQTIHYANRSGVRATCPDCHVPRDWLHKVTRKIQASGEVYHWLLGSVDTPEKFAAKRAEMAQRVWKRMKETDSVECRNCHTTTAMSEEKQTERAWRRHTKGVADGRTCIDCHFGIAHTEPDGPGPQELFATQD